MTINGTKYITGLKGFAAILIVISHLKMQYSGLSDFAWKFVSFSAYFIILFVCISAFTIALSIQKHKKFNFSTYLKRRIVRLAPTYFIVLIIGLLVKTAIYGWPYFFSTYKDLFFQFTFLNLDPIATRAQSSILGVEWMMPIFFWSYFLIPIYFLLLKKLSLFYVVVFIVSILLHFHPTLFWTYKGFGGFGWSFQFYIIMYTYTLLFFWLLTTNVSVLFSEQRIKSVLYLIGFSFSLLLLLTFIGNKSEQFYILSLYCISGYLIWIKPKLLSFFQKKSKVLSGLVNNIDIFMLGVLIYKYMVNFYFLTNPHIVLLVWSVTLIIAGLYRPIIIRILFENRILLFLGSISFGMYIFHPIAITISERILPHQFSSYRIFIIFPLTILAAYILLKKVELPIQKRLEAGGPSTKILLE